MPEGNPTGKAVSSPERMPGSIRVYDYHNYIKDRKAFAFVIPPLIFGVLAATQSPSTTVEILLILFIVLFIGLLLSVPIAFWGGTRLEIGAEGLRYCSPRRKINSLWSQVRKVRRDGSRGSTVFADAGDFTISTRLEPADSPILSWTKALTKNTGTGQYYTELLEEIRRRAPNCQWTIDPFYRLFRNEPSCLVRDSWMPALLVLLIFILPTLIIILLTVLD